MKLASFLNPQLKGRLEGVFFFNPRQSIYREEIVLAVELFGEPRMENSAGGLVIVLPKVPHAQCLFATDLEGNNLGGVVIFTREEAEELEILHIAVCRAWQDAPNPQAGLGSLISEMARLSKRIRGVKRLRLPYGRGFIKIPTSYDSTHI